MTPDDVRARLLPCPFCGGEGLVTQNQSLRSVWRVSCKNCDAGPYGSIGREAAVKKWNRRAAHADLPEEVRELVEALDVARGKVNHVHLSLANNRVVGGSFPVDDETSCRWMGSLNIAGARLDDVRRALAKFKEKP